MKTIICTLIITISVIAYSRGQNDTTRSVSLDEIIISASKFEQSKKEISRQIELIDAKTIAVQNAQTSADLLQSSGNVFVQRSQMGGGSPVLRGFEANKVLLVVDGVRMNNAIYRAGHLQNVITLDQGMLDHLEVIFGPTSLIYGSDALGGVMHFYTRNPSFSNGDSLLFKANVFTRYSSANNEKTGHADFNVGHKKFASLTSFTFSDFDDLKQGHERNDDIGELGLRNFFAERSDGKDSIFVNPDPDVQVGTAYHQYDLLQKFSYGFSEKYISNLNLQYSGSSDIPRYDRLSELTDDTTLRFAEWYYGPQQRFMASWQNKIYPEGKIMDKAIITAAYQNIEESRHDRRFGNDNINHRTETVDVVSLNADASKTFGKNTLNYGIEAFYNKVKSEAERENVTTGEITAQSTRYPDGGSTMQNAAAYITHRYKFSEKFSVNEGVRFSNVMLEAEFKSKEFYPFPYDKAEQNNFDMSGNLGMVYTPCSYFKTYLNLSKGFRVPNVDDLAKVFDSQPGSVLVPNPDLAPEKTYNAEIGFTALHGNRIQLDASAFYTMFSDIIITDMFSFNGNDSILYDGEMSSVMASINRDEASITGLHAALTAFFGPFRIYSTLNYTYGRVKTDTTDIPLAHIPPLFGKTSVSFKKKSWQAEVYAHYNVEKPIKEYSLSGEDNEQYATPDGMPAWMTVNFKSSFHLTKYYELQAGVENILDRNYRVFASGISAPGRNLILALRLAL